MWNTAQKRGRTQCLSNTEELCILQPVRINPDEQDVEISIQFILDGTQTDLPEENMQSLIINNLPEIYSNVSRVQFNAHPPCNEQLIVIQVGQV